MKLILIIALSLLSSCNNTIDRIKNIGNPPPVNRLVTPLERDTYQPVTWNMHDRYDQPPQQESAHVVEEASHNSLWKPGARTFFRDQRARRVGDIVKVVININDNANLANKTEQIRTNKSASSAPNIMGAEKILPKLGNLLRIAPNLSNLIKANQNDDIVGNGTTARTEAIRTQVAAIVTQILPNGNLVIRGHQEVRVNFEKREISVEGIVKPEDIASGNEISSDLIAEARISYGGQGNITNLQQPRYGNQILDAISPF